MEQKPWTRRELLGVTSMAGLAVLSVTTSLGAAAASHYEKVVLAKQPVAYWRLGEAEGPDALDSTANGHRGTYHGTPAFHERGAIKGDANTAIKLDGKPSYIEIANHKDFSQPTSGKGLTIEVWVRPDVLAFEGETDDPYIVWLGKANHNGRSGPCASTAARRRIGPTASRPTSSTRRVVSALARIFRTS